MQYRATSYKGVLSYLSDMIEICRKLHRPDLVEYFTDGWETAVLAAYGPLPPRTMRASGLQDAIRDARAAGVKEPTPRWRQQLLAKPFRKIVRRRGDTELLECGHEHWSTAAFSESGAPATRRRCGECAKSQEEICQSTSTKKLSVSTDAHPVDGRHQRNAKRARYARDAVSTDAVKRAEAVGEHAICKRDISADTMNVANNKKPPTGVRQRAQEKNYA